MATKNEVEYESDAEEGSGLLRMRRRVASDDESEDEDNDDPRLNHRSRVHSDESDGEGGAAEYDDGIEEEDYEDEIDEEVVVGGSAVGLVNESGTRIMAEAGEEQVEGEGQKVSEPFAVPTAGAFYMHDDRFRGNARGRGRHGRILGGKKQWESKDSGKWGHDKFVELSTQEIQHEERRISRGRRGRNRGADRGYARGSRAEGFGNNDFQNQTPKVFVRRRGLTRYEKKKNEAPPMQNRKSGNHFEKTSVTDTGSASTSTANLKHASLPAKTNSFASSLSSASPPFYPSGSSDNMKQRREAQTGSMNRNPPSSVKSANFGPQASLRNIVDTFNMDRLIVSDNTSANGKNLSGQRMVSSGSLAVNASQPSQYRAPKSGNVPGQVRYQPAPHRNQANRLSQPMQTQTVQRRPAQRRAQPSAEAPGLLLGQHFISGSQVSSPPRTTSSIKSYEAGKVESASERGESKGVLVEKGKGSLQANGGGSFIYGGAQIMGQTGNVAAVNGDQNFPAFLPVMQFGHQQPGGIGVPAVGMAYPGYVGQPQNGLGNQEMTWLPILAGAGALGATYGSPYMAVDGSSHIHRTGQPFLTGLWSKDMNTNTLNRELKSVERPELTNDELVQRQSNSKKQPRRYSEMSLANDALN